MKKILKYVLLLLLILAVGGYHRMESIPLNTFANVNGKMWQEI